MRICPQEEEKTKKEVLRLVCNLAVREVRDPQTEVLFDF